MRTATYTSLLLALVLALASCGGGIGAQEQARIDSIAGLPRTEYTKGGVTFSLAELDGMRRTPPDSVPWAQYLADTDSNGQLGYYFFPGYAVELGSPQVRIEYMHKALKGCGTVDSLFAWLQDIYVAKRNGIMNTDGKVGTIDGQVVKILEIQTPEYLAPDSTRYSPKWMAWAYADQGDRFVGFSYTAIDADAYKQGFSAFKDLVRSYKDNHE